jgi:hypothetical protein
MPSTTTYAPRSYGVPLQKRFGRLLFVELAGFDGAPGKRRSLWKMQCDCGQQVVRTSNSIRSGNTQSCGCLGNETRANSTRTHGKTGSPTYISWSLMISRCTNPKATKYEAYGAKGILVCDQWMGSFTQFLADVGERPAGMTIDRIDNSKGYEPDNVRWATPYQQAKNRSNVKLITAFGETLCLAEWERKTGVSRSTIRKRINAGMTAEKALAKCGRGK